MDQDSHGTRPQVDHYRDEYWNDLSQVTSYLSRLATGEERLWWMDHLKHEYADPPLKRALVIGCGNGWVERDLFDRGIADHFDAFDASRGYLDQAEAQRHGRSINYFVSDFESFRPSCKYDLIVNVAALHHARRLYRMLDVLRAALDRHGIMVNWEYVGPSRNRYSPDHVMLMRAVNDSLPERFRTKHPIVQDIRTFLNGDPTEAVHSAEIEQGFANWFEVLERHPLNGGLAYQLLWNNVAPFRGDDPEARWALEYLLGLDESMTAAGLVPTLFCYSIGRPRARPSMRARLDRWFREPVRESLVTLTGGLYPSDIAAEGRRLAGSATRSRWFDRVLPARVRGWAAGRRCYRTGVWRHAATQLP